jgi:quercetin dioxygenase-like cupin family protein
MRKLAVVAFLVLSLMTSAIGFSAAAQDATPAPESGDEGIPGATVEIIAQSDDSDILGMTLYEIRLESGVEVDFHEHFGSVTWYIDSGSMELTVETGDVWVRCAGDCLGGEEPVHTADDGSMLVPHGVTVTLETGDRAIQHAASTHSYRAGDDGTVILASTSYDRTMELPEASPAAGPSGPRPKACAGGCL